MNGCVLNWSSWICACAFCLVVIQTVYLSVILSRVKLGTASVYHPSASASSNTHRLPLFLSFPLPPFYNPFLPHSHTQVSLRATDLDDSADLRHLSESVRARSVLDATALRLRFAFLTRFNKLVASLLGAGGQIFAHFDLEIDFFFFRICIFLYIFVLNLVLSVCVYLCVSSCLA